MDPKERPSSSSGLTSTFTHTHHQAESGEEDNLVPGVTDLQEEHSRTSPVLRSTLEHIVQQLDILTQVSSATFYWFYFLRPSELHKPAGGSGDVPLDSSSKYFFS